MGIPAAMVMRAAPSFVAMPPLDMLLPRVVELASISGVMTLTSRMRRAFGLRRGSAS